MGARQKTGISVPSDLEVRFVRSGGEELAILAFTVEDAEMPSCLTEAEKDVVELVLRGCSTRKIAELRGRAERTISNQLANVFKKLHVGSRAELIAQLTSPKGGR